MITHLDQPKPILHLYGENPCGGVAYLALVEVDPADLYNTEQLRYPDGSRLEPAEIPHCRACGRSMTLGNFSQMVRGHRLAVDPFTVQMKAALARAGLESTSKSSTGESA